MSENVKNKKFLVVTADDFGISEKVNAGIIYSHKSGVVTSTSIMTNMPALENAASLLEAHKELGIGLHANLTCGAPTSSPDKIKSLIDHNGQFHSKNDFIKRYLSGKIVYDEICLELSNQMKIAKIYNIEIAHIDCHHHIQAFNDVFRAVYAIARQFKVKFIRMPVSSRYLKEFMMTPGNLKRIVLMTIAQNTLHKHHLTCVRRPDNVLGIVESAYIQKWDVFAELMKKCDIGVNELVCHPGYLDIELKKLDPYVNREAEIFALTSGRIRQEIETHNITLTNFARYPSALRMG